MPKAFWVVLLLTNFLGTSASAQILKDKVTIGRVEWVELPDLKLKFRARIDSGAKTTSIHAYGIEEVTREGSLWVKFRTRDSNGKEAEVVRKVESTQNVTNATGTTGRRYVVREKIKLGPITKEISLNLNNRQSMAYKFLIGRNFLLGRFIVDVARSHVTGD